jgi:hypothetical protein
VALSRIQTGVLRLLASHRDPESYVAGATPLNRDASRYSDDIDVFHDREERVAAAALDDAEALGAAEYRVSWLRQLPLIYTAQVTQGNASTRLEWVVDSDFRFFPTIRRNANYPAADWRALSSSEPLDPKDITLRLRSALDEAETFVIRMPTDKMGVLFLKDGQVLQPDPGRLTDYQTHAGQRRGHWPSSAEITAAMFEHYKKPPGSL